MADDFVDAPSWSLDARVRIALLIDAGRRALREEDASGAFALAEEALDDAPDDLDALRLVADAAPRCGHARVGVLACAQLRARGEEPGVREVDALLAGGDAAAALSALGRLPEGPRELAVRAQVLDALGDSLGADRAWCAAAAADPRAYPTPPQVGEEEWGSLLLEALSSLDHHVRSAAASLHIAFEERPSREDLVRAAAPYPPFPPTIAGLLRREEERGVLKLYRRNLQRGATSAADLVLRIRAVLVDELTPGEG